MFGKDLKNKIKFNLKNWRNWEQFDEIWWKQDSGCFQKGLEFADLE